MITEKEHQLFVDAYNKAESYNEYEKAYKLLVPLVEETGDASLQDILATMYDEGLGVPKSFTKAFKWWKLSAEQGYANAQVDFGALCLVKKWIFFGDNKKEAIKLFRLAAEQGNDRGQMALGNSYKYGDIIPKDYKEAIKWFRLAAEQGNVHGLSDLGEMYELGRGVPVNFNEAVKFYRLASEKGDTDTQIKLGKMYELGQGVPVNFNEAVKFYRLASEKGDTDTQIKLGKMYSKGQGVEKDYVLACAWIYFARFKLDKFDQGAMKDIDRMAEEMTPSQLEKAKEIANFWRDEEMNGRPFGRQ